MRSACVFSIDDSYVIPFQVFYHSLESTQSLPPSTPVYILHTSTLGHASRSLVRDFIAAYQRNVTFIDATECLPSDLPIRSTDHVSIATFYRLFITDILPAGIDHVVYLDVDMIALQNVSSLFHVRPVGGVAAVDHCRPADSLRLFGELCEGYFQAGLMVIPLHRWRAQGIVDTYLHLLTNKADIIKYWDQDVLNLAFKNQWERLPVYFNVCKDVSKMLSPSDLVSKTKIYHYSGLYKPWNTYSGLPFIDAWDSCYRAVFGCEFDRDRLRPGFFQWLLSGVRLRLKLFFYGRR